MNTAFIKARLLHALTEYDRRQSKRKDYNRYAFGQYLLRLDEVMADISRGADVRQAVTAGFLGRLADACLRALGLPITTVEEARGTIRGAFPEGWAYAPTSVDPAAGKPDDVAEASAHSPSLIRALMGHDE